MYNTDKISMMGVDTSSIWKGLYVSWIGVYIPSGSMRIEFVCFIVSDRVDIVWCVVVCGGGGFSN